MLYDVSMCIVYCSTWRMWVLALAHLFSMISHAGTFEPMFPSVSFWFKITQDHKFYMINFQGSFASNIISKFLIWNRFSFRYEVEFKRSYVQCIKFDARKFFQIEILLLIVLHATSFENEELSKNALCITVHNWTFQSKNNFSSMYSLLAKINEAFFGTIYSKDFFFFAYFTCLRNDWNCNWSESAQKVEHGWAMVNGVLFFILFLVVCDLNGEFTMNHSYFAASKSNSLLINLKERR